MASHDEAVEDQVNTELGPVFTEGRSYRARAEARQREYRARLGVAHGRYGHFLAEDAANEGRNFVLPEAFESALSRKRAGKGVAPRTFENMLSSQAMCFNIFAPLYPFDEPRRDHAPPGPTSGA